MAADFCDTGGPRANRLSRRQLLGGAVTFGVSGVLAPSSRAVAAQAPQRGGYLKAGMQGGESTNTLDPALNVSQVPFGFCRLWGEFLVRVKRDGTLDYRIAEQISASDDARTWTLKIRDGVEFHDGRTVSAQDVVATLERHADEKSQSGAHGILKSIAGIKADGRNVVISLSDPDADFPYLMTDYHLVIQPNGGKNDPGAGISAGPYKVSVFEPGIRCGGERFANFWDADRMGFADRVEIVVINDATARIAALRGGQVHMINRVEPKIVDLVKRIPDVRVESISGRGFYAFNMFCDTPPFDNNDLRMALKLAMDREQMLTTILHGHGTVGNDYPINAAYPLHPAGIEQRVYDPERAAALYRRSGHSGPIVLHASDVAFPGGVEAAQLYQQSAAKAGITIEVKRVPGDGYWSEVWNRQPFSLSYWSGRTTQDQTYSTVYLSDAEWNDIHFRRPEFDSWILAARGELDPEKRRKLYRDAALLMRDEGGLMVPLFNDYIDAVSQKVQGYEAHPQAELMDGYGLAECWLAG
jgi:peptide/nickel transport system substrate-binding protein